MQRKEKHMSDEYILEMRNICKEFPGVKALDNVNFKVRRGEIHCLVGENGAGKSTLMKVLSGVWKYGTSATSSITERSSSSRASQTVKQKVLP